MNILGKVMAVIGVLTVMIFANGIGKMAGKPAVDKTNESKLDETIEKKLMEMSKQMNSQLPTMIDEETRFDTTMCVGKHMNYKYTMVNISDKDIDKKAFQSEMKSMLVKNQCSNENMIKMLKMGIQYDYILTPYHQLQ